MIYHSQKRHLNSWFAPSGEDVVLERLQSESKEVSGESEEPLLDICSPCSSCSLASSIVVHISEEERQKYEEEIRKLYKQLDDKVTNGGLCVNMNAHLHAHTLHEYMERKAHALLMLMNSR